MKKLAIITLVTFTLIDWLNAQQLLKDIRSGTLNSRPSFLTSCNNLLFFTANDGLNGTELWRSNGSNTGTLMVKDINPGAASSLPQRGTSSKTALVDVDGILFFAANNGTNGIELWKSDGTATGTKMVKDINAGVNDSEPDSLINVNGTLYFRANDGINGYELWKSDGTAAGTILVKDIASGASSSRPEYLTNVNGTLYFTAYNDVLARQELWKSNGSSANTIMVKDMNAYYLTNVNGTLFFAGNAGSGGSELWKSDGTSAGTVMVKDIYTGTNKSSIPKYLTAVNNLLYFNATDATTGSELWRSDGTEVGTFMVADYLQGFTPNGITPLSGDPRHLKNVNGELFFTGFPISGGNVPNTTILKVNTSGNLNSVVSVVEKLGSDFTELNGKVYFSAQDLQNGRELWSTAGFEMDINTEPFTVGGACGNNYCGSSFPSELTNVNGILFFTAYNKQTGEELWKIGNGTTTSIEALNNSISFSIYPNPTNNILNITCTEPITRVEVYNMLGELVHEKKGEVNTLSVDVLAQGVYTISLKTLTGKTAVSRFTKQ
jgi:ELWxxDGT repeat protein